ncbi:MAG: hypothetical protein AAFV45_04050 [Pseudomonadota bacterium]
MNEKSRAHHAELAGWIEDPKTWIEFVLAVQVRDGRHQHLNATVGA